MGFEFIKKLPTPDEIRNQYPIDAKIKALKEKRDQEIRDVFTGKSDKFLAIIGPCSADNEDAVCDYLLRLRKVQDKIADKVLIIPRVYTNKPRTTGEGYKGMVHQPDPEKKEKTETGVFAEGCSFYKIVLLFIIGAFLGDITETIFCRITAGVWMSRSSLVWGPFSIVWGLAIALATWFLYNYRDRSDGFLFAFGTFLGGAYEYICSVFTEIVFGKVFWDYSDIPFNLGGRINLLYCFFWGIAAVVWLKKFYPVISRWIEKIPMKFGEIITWILIVFMVANMLVSTLALARYDERAHQKPAANAIEQTIDAHFPDARMEKIYPNAKAIN